MKKLSVLFLFLLVGTFLFSLNFGSSLTVGNSCNPSDVDGYSWTCSVYGTSYAGQSLGYSNCRVYSSTTGPKCCCDVKCNNNIAYPNGFIPDVLGNGGTYAQCGPPTPPAPTQYTWYYDGDNDGYHNLSTIYQASLPGTGWTTTVKTSGDCNDSNVNVKPGIIENCSTSYDDNCNGLVNENCVYSVLSKPFFAKLNSPDVSISSVNLGDTVLLRFPGASLNGTTINYSLGVYNASGANWWNPFSYFTKAWDNSQKILGTAYEPFTITQTDLHRFNASIVGINQWNASDNISIISGEDSYSTVNLLSSLQDMRVQNGSLVWFNQSSTDEDDLLQITWDFGDGQNFTCYNYSAVIDASQCNVPHAYAANGVYLASLSVKGMSRGSTRSTSFFAYSFSPGINVVPIVSSPQFGTSNGNFVNFNASASFVANCSTSILNPAFTANNLNCTYIHAPNKLANQSLNGYNLTFSWNMDGSIVSGNWSNYNSAVVFSYYFLNSGTHNTHLNLIYSDS